MEMCRPTLRSSGIRTFQNSDGNFAGKANQIMEATKNPPQSGRTALVTGASHGLGRAIALELAAGGANLAVNYLASHERALKLCHEIEASGGCARPFRADVRDKHEVDSMAGQIEAEFGGVDILVLNATGPQPMVAIEDQTWELFLDQLEFFVKSPLLLVQRFLPGMRQRGFGRIINIGSEVFEAGVARFANYVAAKGAQLGLTRSWARELAPDGITVNLVAPGWIPTERHADATQEELDAYRRNIPMQHMGDAKDVGNVVAFLASAKAGFITGQKISVNGGNTFA